MQSLKKEPGKFVRRFVFEDTQCLYALVEVEPKITKFKLRKQSDKNNLRITAKPHAHLQTLTKTPAKFQKDPTKIVGGDALTRMDKICDGHSDRQLDRGRQTL